MKLTVNEFRHVFAAWANIMSSHCNELIALDSVVGDGDLGLTMADGFAAAAAYAGEFTGTDLGNLFYFSGKAMATAVPSSMGTLMASGLMEVGKQLKKQAELDLSEIDRVLTAFANGVATRGKAKRGEKTVLDSLIPAAEVLAGKSTDDSIQLLRLASAAAEEGAQNTVGMLALHGRAAGRGEQSRQLLDPGAVVGALFVKAMADCLISLTQ